MLESHSKATVTCYGMRCSSKTPAACCRDRKHANDSEKKHLLSPKLFWNIGKLRKDNTAFTIMHMETECQFGHKYYKDKPSQSSRIKIQGTRKLGCKAHITVKKCVFYPEYKVDNQGIASRNIKYEKMQELKKNLEKNPNTGEVVFHFFAIK